MRRLLLLGATLAFAAPAAASPYLRYGLQDDAWLQFGPGTLQSRLARLDGLGVKLVRFTLHWDSIAARRPADARSPLDPAYDWSGPDAVLQGLRTHKVSIVLTLLGTPPWANGGQSPRAAPTAGSDFADFAYAAAKRYSWVRQWIVWNEPNQQRWLSPASPAVYVTKLLNPAYAAIHSALAGVQVAGGATAPRADQGGVSPVDWILAMGKLGARLDAYAHHPYPSSPAETPFTGGCAQCRTITMAELPRLLGTVSRALGPKRIWLDEYGYQTRPPDPFGVTPALQALYIGEAGLRAWESPRVDLLIQYLYRDEPELDRFQSGLVFSSGAAKPSLNAFRLPFAEVSRAGTATKVWGETRSGHAYRLQILRGGQWAWAGDVAAPNPAGFFVRKVNAGPGSQLRVWNPAGGFFSNPLVVR